MTYKGERYRGPNEVVLHSSEIPDYENDHLYRVPQIKEAEFKHQAAVFITLLDLLDVNIKARTHQMSDQERAKSGR